jgi:frataxin-like iron-binding protein CyaY
MRLPMQSPKYSASAENERNRVIEQADYRNHKRNSDVEIGEGRLILTAPNGGRYNITVSNAGALVVTSI